MVPAHKAYAQDDPPGIPIFDSVSPQAQTAEAAQSCVTVQTLNPVPEIQEMAVVEVRDNMIFVPLAVRGPQCIPLPPELIGAIGLESNRKVIVARNTGDVDAFELVGGVSTNRVDVPLNPSIAYEFFEQAARQRTAPGYYTRIKGLFYLGSESVSDATAAVIPPSSPFVGGDTSLMTRLTTASELYYDAIFIKLKPLTVLYTCKDQACDPITLAALCPDMDLDDVAAIYLGSYPVFKTFGPFTQTEMWTRIRHTPRTLQIENCPNAEPYQFIDGPTTWALLDEIYKEEIDTVIEGQRDHLSRNIELSPQGGDPFAAPATFDTISDGGTVTLIGIAVTIGTVIYYFLGILEAIPVVP